MGGSGTLAGWWYRVGATLIDEIMLLILYIVMDLAVGATSAFGVWIVISAAYLIVLIGAQGRTVGNLAVGTQVVDATTGALPGFGKAAIRWLTLFMLSLPLILLITYPLDVLWPLWDGRNQTLHDKAAGTLVVRV